MNREKQFYFAPIYNLEPSNGNPRYTIARVRAFSQREAFELFITEYYESALGPISDNHHTADFHGIMERR